MEDLQPPPVDPAAPEPPPPPPTCPKCLAVIFDGAKFCPACGVPLVQGARRASGFERVSKVRQRLATGSNPVIPAIIFFTLWLFPNLIGVLVVDEKHRVPFFIGMDIFTTTATFIWAATLRRDVIPALFKFRCDPKWYGITLAAAYPIAFLMTLFGAFLQKAFDMPDASYSQIFWDENYGFWMIFLIIAVQPAIVEETAFRGVVRNSLKDLMNPREALIVTSCAFGIMHCNPVMLLPLTVLGLYIGVLREASGSLAPGMLAHFLHNLLIIGDEQVKIFPF